MIQIRENVDLLPFNTFGLPATARYLVELDDARDLPELCRLKVFQEHQIVWLGSGSNVLFDGDFDGLVVKMTNKGIREIARSDGMVWLHAEAGEVWHDFVCHTLSIGLSGLENLSLIPGTVGASPVQNIGAYGVEVKDLIDTVHVFDLHTREFIELSNAACHFAYRDSVFKHEKGRYVIWAVTFKLSEQFVLKANYGDLAQVLREQCGENEATAQDVSQAVCTIRQSKLPNPAQLGNVGSFFKNPVISAKQAFTLCEKYPNMPKYPQHDGSVKIAAGWLIEQCRLKGFQIGGAAVHDKQALVVVNQNHANADDLKKLATYIVNEVKKKFNIDLHPEPEWIRNGKK